MRAISLWNPWASLIAAGAKFIETRSWPTDYRGPLGIHAALKWNRELEAICGFEPFQSALMNAGFDPAKPRFDMPFGAIVATCKLVDCVPTRRISVSTQLSMRVGDELSPWTKLQTGAYVMRPDQEDFGDFGVNRFAWLLGDIKKLDTPVPWKGTQGFFEWREREAVSA